MRSIFCLSSGVNNDTAKIMAVIQSKNLDYLTLKVKTQQSFETPLIIFQLIQ